MNGRILRLWIWLNWITYVNVLLMIFWLNVLNCLPKLLRLRTNVLLRLNVPKKLMLLLLLRMRKTNRRLPPVPVEVLRPQLSLFSPVVSDIHWPQLGIYCPCNTCIAANEFFVSYSKNSEPVAQEHAL